MNLSLRPARPADYEFAKRLYIQTMRWAIERLFGWDQVKVDATFKEQFLVEEVRIIVLDDEEVGWLQAAERDGPLFLKQIYIDPVFQRRGIDTRIMSMLFDEARQRAQAVTLGVIKFNPALALYQRFGFRVTHEDEYKFYMRRDS